VTSIYRKSPSIKPARQYDPTIIEANSVEALNRIVIRFCGPQDFKPTFLVPPGLNNLYDRDDVKLADAGTHTNFLEEQRRFDRELFWSQ
jgi:hypothetical protein